MRRVQILAAIVILALLAVAVIDPRQADMGTIGTLIGGLTVILFGWRPGDRGEDP